MTAITFDFLGDFKEFLDKLKSENIKGKDFLEQWGLFAFIDEPDSRYVSYFPMEAAIKDGDLDMIKYLEEHGFSMTYGYDKRAAINTAVRHNSLDIIKYLGDKGDIDDIMDKVIKYATKERRLELVRYGLSTSICSEERIHGFVKIITTKEIKDLLTNYVQFSNTKAAK